MQYSSYQLEIFQHIRQRGGNAAVISVPGSGKTTTAVKSVAEINPIYNVLMSAFNVSTKVELATRTREYDNVEVANYNGFGWQICLNQMPNKPRIDKDKTDKILEQIVREKKLFYKFRYPVKRLVSMFKSLDVRTVDDANAQFDDIIDHYQIEIPEELTFREVTLNAFGRSISNTAIFDFDDQKLMPLLLGLRIPRYDYVYIDEFQDTCPLEAHLMLQAAMGGMVTAIGDPNQAIYGFKGATPNAIEDFIISMNAITLPLSICYRCPRKVVENAARVFPGIEPAPNAAEGVVGHLTAKEFRAKVQPGDFVICRTTEPLVTRCLQDISEGKNSTVRGRELGQNLLYILTKVSNGGNDDIENLAAKLRDYYARQVDKLNALRRESEIGMLDDKIDSIYAIINGLNCESKSDVEAGINRVFTDGNPAAIQYMTGHKAKGLQANNVFHLRPDLIPHPRAKLPWMQEEEMRLLYVINSRSMAEHYTVEPEPHELRGSR